MQLLFATVWVSSFLAIGNRRKSCLLNGDGIDYRASYEYAHLYHEHHPRRHLPLFSTGAYLQTFVQVECVFEGNPATAGSGFTGPGLSNCNGICRQNTTGQLAVVVVGEYLDLRPVELKRGCFFECTDAQGC